MKWIIGLGNPGSQYQYTKHNIGFMALDLLAEQSGILIQHKKCKALIGEGVIKGQKVYLIKPQTYMNLSGEAVRAFMDFYKADLSDMIVVYDDLDTSLGQIRLRYQGSAGGHNGIKSIIQHTGTQVFNRIRMGINRPQSGYPIVDYVLSAFSKSEAAAVLDTLHLACRSIEFALENPFDKTMAKFNA